MFGLNTRVGKSFFKDAGDKLKVASIFFTMQGEGPKRGHPALFVRLSHCSLSCSWCDAFFEEGDWFTPSEIQELATKEITKYFNGDVPNWASADNKRQMGFVITGGEPTLQDNIKSLLELAEEEYSWTQIESNGILKPNVPESTIVVVSPKCMEKVDISQGFKRYIPTSYMNPNPETLARANCLKFIVEDQPDFDSPYQTIPEWAHIWHSETGRDIFISPMNIYKREPQKAIEFRNKLKETGYNKSSIEERSMYDEVVSFWEPGLFDMDANQRNHEHAARYALKYGFIFQMQLHLFASFA